LNIDSPTTQIASLPPVFAAKAPAKEPDGLPDPLANLMIPLPSLSDTPGPATDANDSSAAHHSAAPTAAPATAAKSERTIAAAAKPERIVASAADVAQQFHVSCIMFSDQGSTAIINGSPVKVGATIRAEGTAKSGLPEEAVVKRIDRNCVEVELGGERYLLRI
jgi:hypothetical protein